MKLPEIKFIFQRLSSNLVKRSARGTVLLILKDTIENNFITFNNVAEVDATLKTENIDYVKHAFKGGAYKVIVQIIKGDRDLDTVLEASKSLIFNWAAMPEAITAENEKIIEYIKKLRKNNKMRKAVVGNIKADDKAIVNFTSTNIKEKNKETKYSAQQFTARIAGELASTDLKNSATYKVLADIESFEEISDIDTNINNGELVLVNDGEKIKIATAVNSLTTIEEPYVVEDMKKIKIVEAMDLILTDIHSVFQDNYVGKFPNKYDNKILLFENLKDYLEDLQKNDILDKDSPVSIRIDLEAHKEYLKEQEKDSDIPKIKLEKLFTGSSVFAIANIKILDAMENFVLKINM